MRVVEVSTHPIIREGLSEMTKQYNTDNANTGIDPKEYFDGLGGKFTAIAVRPAFRVKAAKWAPVTFPFFVERKVTAEEDSWLVRDSLGRYKLLASLDGLALVPLGNIRKMSLPAGIEPEAIWGGEFYKGILGTDEEAPRRGRVLRARMEGRESLRTSSVSTGAGQTRTKGLELLGKTVIRTMSFLGFKLQDGGIFLDEERFKLFFEEGIPDGIVLIEDGKPFEVAVAPDNATLRFADNDRYPVEKGDLVYVNENTPGGIAVDSLPSFVERYAPIA